MVDDRADGLVPRWIELSRHNLMILLAKLDGYPPNSLCTIEKDGVFIKAVEDTCHYSQLPPGVMHPATERAIKEA